MKILIVEDEAIVAMSLQFLLKLDGHLITGIAADLVDVIASLDQDLPDVALVDIELAHGSSGFDVAAELRERGISCFFLTGNLPAQPQAGIALGCIQKPYREETLQAALGVAQARRAGEIPAGPIPEELVLY